MYTEYYEKLKTKLKEEIDAMIDEYIPDDDYTDEQNYYNLIGDLKGHLMKTAIRFRRECPDFFS